MLRSHDPEGALAFILDPEEESMTQDEDPITLVEQLAEANDDFRAALLANPRQAIEQSFGVELPHDWSAEVTVDEDGTVHVART